jgi:hypothetical protein
MSTTALPTTADAAASYEPERRPMRGFPLAGALAGIGGFVGAAVLWTFADPAAKARGADALVDHLVRSRWAMHVGTSLTWITIAALIVFAVGYLRFLGRRLGEDAGAVQTARLGLTAGIGTMILTTAMRAIVVGGLPGMMDAPMYTAQDISTLHILADQAQWVGWMGVVVAMAASVTPIVRDRLLPRWFGIFTAGLVVVCAGMTLVLGLPYSAGLVATLWLVAGSVVLTRALRREG